MQDQHALQVATTAKIRILQKNAGARLQAVRLARRLTLEKLSRLTGLTPDTLDRLEMGKGEINLHHLMRLSIALHIQADTLLREG